MNLRAGGWDGGLLAWVVVSVCGVALAREAPFNLVQCEERTPVIDGMIKPGEWPEEHMIRLSRGFHPEHGIRLYFAHDAAHLYLGAYVENGNLWADGAGGGSGEYWESHHDDSIEWYFDPDNSADPHLMDNDRYLALNIGNIGDPRTGPGIVSRRSFNKGTGDGGAVGTGYPGVLPEGLVYRVAHHGTVNNPADRDAGYSIEVALPWSALLRPRPADGEYMGINVILISDDTGGERDWSDNFHAEPPSARFTLPLRPDEFVEMRCSRLTGSQSGLSGPANYQRIQFHRASDNVPPGAVQSLRAETLRPYAVTLAWLAPGDNNLQGVCATYDIRYATAPISTASFDTMPAWPFRIHPAGPGQTQTARVMGLAPGTAYWFGVRGVDEKGNRGQPVIIGPVHTPSLTQAGIQLPPHLYRGAVRVAPGGRYFMTENGAQFIPVGHHLHFADVATRHLYPGLVWTGDRMWNYSTEPGAYDKVVAYLDLLQAHGVTAMRLFMEDFFTPIRNNGAFNAENGAYWIEFPRGVYNPDMGAFLRSLLQLCAERGIYVCLTPLETYSWGTHLQRTCWGTDNGGPLTDINDFYGSPDTLQMCKDRWTWVIHQVQISGYADAVFGYDVLNEWDSWEWTRAAANPDVDATVRYAFIRELALHVRSLDPERLLLTHNAAVDPHGALAVISLYDELFDASLPHLYFPGCREPWHNPQAYQPAAVFREQSRAVAWWTLNRLNRMPVLNGEWGPADGWHPTPSQPFYIPEFTEEDDNRNTRILWFTELCSGAAGPGLRIQGGVRAFEYGLHLSDYMLGVQQTLSAFTENGVLDPVFDFTDFPSENRRGQIHVEGTSAAVLHTGCSDGEKGLVYLLQDRNYSSGTIRGARLRVGGLNTAALKLRAEFWKTGPGQTAPTHVVEGVVRADTVEFAVPAFSEDWAIRFYDAGIRASALTLPVDYGNWVWWDVFDTAAGTWLQLPHSDWCYAPTELVFADVRPNRWYWIGVFPSDRPATGHWFGRF